MAEECVINVVGTHKGYQKRVLKMVSLTEGKLKTEYYMCMKRKYLSRITFKIWGIIVHLVILRRIKFTSEFESDIQIIGTEYGKKAIINFSNLENSLLLSAGCGEDISFDVEFLSKYKKSMGILVDPTPRAISHVESVFQRIGLKSEISFNKSGNQDPKAYDLSLVQKERIRFIPKALWKNNEAIFLFPPKNSEHVSHSVIDIQKTKSKKSPLKASSCTVSEVLKDQIGYKNIDILKLDIEGSQLEVCKKMFEDNLYPTQILIEIDELYFPGFNSLFRGYSCIQILNRYSYRCFYNDKYDFSFIRMNK